MWQHCAAAAAAAATAGADCMGLMARAARMAARQGREAITEEDIYAAMENKAMEAFQVSSMGFAAFAAFVTLVDTCIAGSHKAWSTSPVEVVTLLP